tara:strand:- start:5928 stop:6218 length:291 start_codon:yes stop_codon:yes gene_type:complete
MIRFPRSEVHNRRVLVGGLSREGRKAIIQSDMRKLPQACHIVHDMQTGYSISAKVPNRSRAGGFLQADSIFSVQAGWPSCRNTNVRFEHAAANYYS